MRRVIFHVVLVVMFMPLIIGCENRSEINSDRTSKSEINQELAYELTAMFKVDQIAAGMPQGKFRELSRDDWHAFKDSVFVTHQKRLDEILDQFGYPGFDMVGKTEAMHFWVMVQHSDHDSDFQKKALEKLKKEVDRNNADPSHYGFLADRINNNTGKPLIYGTQVSFNQETCQSYPINLADSVNVNERRKSIGLPPLEEYLNEMTELNFGFNKEHCKSLGIDMPPLYKSN